MGCRSHGEFLGNGGFTLILKLTSDLFCSKQKVVAGVLAARHLTPSLLVSRAFETNCPWPVAAVAAVAAL